MVHAPELLGYEQYTPFPAACQWQSERPPPVAGAFAGLFMALGATLLAWERPALTAGLPRAFVCEPAPFVAANSTYSLRLRQSPSEGRPALAGRSTSLPWGHRPHFGERVRQNRQTSPASFFSSPLPFWLGAYCHLQGPPKSVALGRKTGPGGPLNEFALGAIGPILAKGHAKNRQTSPASFFSLPLPFWLGAYCHLQVPPKSVDFGGKNSLVGKSMRRKSSQGLSLEATHSFSGTQKS